MGRKGSIKQQRTTGRKPVREHAVAPGVRWMPAAVTILLAGFLLYGNTLVNGFVLDDKGIITQNRFTVQGFGGIPELLTTSYWEGIGVNVRSYRPLAPVTFAIETGLWGAQPAASHLVNLLICIGTGLLMFAFLKRLTARASFEIPSAWLLAATLLFMAHPVHTEVVANVKGRDSMLEFFFLLLSAHYLLRFLDTARRSDLVISVAAFFPALLSKESAITYIVMVPVMLVLFDRRPLVSRAAVSALYLVPAALFLLLYFRYSDVGEFARLHLLDNSLTAVAPAHSVWATKILILGKYLWLLLWPHPLVYDYSYNTLPMTSFSDPAVWVSGLVYLSLVVFLLAALGRKAAGGTLSPAGSLATFSVAWFIMGLFASSNLVMLIGSTMGERFLYTPSLGFVLMAVAGLWIFGKRWQNRAVKGHPVLWACLALVFLAWTVRTIVRNRDWKDDRTLFSADLTYLPQNAKAHDFLANVYRAEGEKATDTAVKNDRFQQAIALKEKAVSILPGVPEMVQQLAYLYGAAGKLEKAIEAYRQAISLNPGEATNYLQIGKAFGMMGKPAEALEYLRKGEEVDPQNAAILTALGITLGQTGDLEAAVGYFERALERDPSDPQAASYLNYTRQQLQAKRNLTVKP